jgi:hypothetical protein
MELIPFSVLLLQRPVAVVVLLGLMPQVEDLAVEGTKGKLLGLGYLAKVMLAQLAQRVLMLQRVEEAVDLVLLVLLALQTKGLVKAVLVLFLQSQVQDDFMLVEVAAEATVAHPIHRLVATGALVVAEVAHQEMEMQELRHHL